MSKFSAISLAQLSPTNPILNLSAKDQSNVLSATICLNWQAIRCFSYNEANTKFPATITWNSANIQFQDESIKNLANIDRTGSAYVEVIGYFLMFGLLAFTNASGFVASTNYDAKSGKMPYTPIFNPGAGGVPALPSAYTKFYAGHYMTITDNVVDLGGSKLKSIATPVDANDATSKTYVDTSVTTLSKSTASDIKTALDTGKAYTDNTVANASSTINASIASVQSQVSSILDGADVTTDSLGKIAQLAKTLDAADNASLASAVATLQGEIELNSSDISGLKVLTTGYATEFDTALIKSAGGSSVTFGSHIDLQYKNLNNAQIVDASTVNVSTITTDSLQLVLSPDDCQFYGPNQIVLLETVDVCPDKDSDVNKFNGWLITGTNIPPNTYIVNYRYDYSNWSSVWRCMYANLSQNIPDPTGTNYTYTIAPPISVQTGLNLNSFALSNIADGINPSDAVAFHQLTDYKTANDSTVASVLSNLGLEASRASTAETNLANSISAEQTRAENSEADLQTAINTLTTNLSTLTSREASDIATEIARAQTAEATLTTKCNDLQAQLTVQSGYITKVYSYLWGTAPSVVPTR